MKQFDDSISIIEAAKQYTAWRNCSTMPEYAARMQLCWLEILRHKTSIALSRVQDRVAGIDSEDG